MNINKTNTSHRLCHPVFYLILFILNIGIICIIAIVSLNQEKFREATSIIIFLLVVNLIFLLQLVQTILTDYLTAWEKHYDILRKNLIWRGNQTIINAEKVFEIVLLILCGLFICVGIISIAEYGIVEYLQKIIVESTIMILVFGICIAGIMLLSFLTSNSQPGLAKSVLLCASTGLIIGSVADENWGAMIGLIVCGVIGVIIFVMLERHNVQQEYERQLLIQEEYERKLFRKRQHALKTRSTTPKEDTKLASTIGQTIASTNTPTTNNLQSSAPPPTATSDSLTQSTSPLTATSDISTHSTPPLTATSDTPTQQPLIETPLDTDEEIESDTIQDNTEDKAKPIIITAIVIGMLFGPAIISPLFPSIGGPIGRYLDCIWGSGIAGFLSAWFTMQYIIVANIRKTTEEQKDKARIYLGMGIGMLVGYFYGFLFVVLLGEPMATLCQYILGVGVGGWLGMQIAKIQNQRKIIQKK